MFEFAAKLKQYREIAGLSQSELARKLGMDASYISRLEAGERRPPRRNTIQMIGDALHLDFDEKNTLLIAAGYAPIDFNEVVEVHPAMKLLAEVLDDDFIPTSEKQLVEQYIRQLRNRYSRQQE